MAGPSPAEREAIAYLRTPRAIRERCGRLLALAEAGELEHLLLRPERLEAVAERVVAVTRRSYPGLRIPYHARWRHFAAGGRERAPLLDARLAGLDPAEQARARIDLVVTSVLLDAGAGPRWRFAEPGTGLTLTRSEGLGVASFHAFLAGSFSSDPARPLQADAKGLQAVTPAALGEAFQVGPDNPLVGLEGRARLLQELGRALSAAPALFGQDPPRVGHLYDALVARAQGDAVPAAEVLALVLEGLGPIWPGRVSLGGVNLGDTWPHPALRGPGPGDGLVPFHKLSQWLSYSLLEPLEAAGLRVLDLDALTGLPEYRNGGLLLDLGLLELRRPEEAARAHAPGEPLVVEWRALTVALLDRIAGRVRALLGLDAASFPLAKVLEGGTWAAGREVARERRPDGGPPFPIESDGTVF